MGNLGSNGVISPSPSQKVAHIIQSCNQIDTPLVFVQNVTGYMVGKGFEADGIVKKGSQMINAVTNTTVPHLTGMIGSSDGAGTSAMSARLFTTDEVPGGHGHLPGDAEAVLSRHRSATR